jgi:hypothetical protein
MGGVPEHRRFVDEEQVDPAALMIAIITVAQTPLLEVGAWDILNTVVAVVAFTVVWAFAVAGERRRELKLNVERAAVSAVIGLVAAIILAFPIQAVRARTLSSEDAADGGPWRARSTLQCGRAWPSDLSSSLSSFFGFD